jgi:signal peptidase I
LSARRWRFWARGGRVRPRIAFALLLALLLFELLTLSPYHIPSRSMEDTLLVGDYLVVEKLSYGLPIPGAGSWHLPALRSPRRGDVLVFENPDDGRDYIKRCIGLPGDRIELVDGQLRVNDRAISEPYLKSDGSAPHGNFGPYEVPPRHIFVLGDNRNSSRDSRAFGALSLSTLRGRAAFIYYSWDPERRRTRWSRILHAIH